MDIATGAPPRTGGRCGDAYGPAYRVVRAEVLARNGGVCALCGFARAVEAHHSGLKYPCGSDRLCCGRRKVEVGDLVGLCSLCHELVTTLRRFRRAGGSVYVLVARFKEVIAGCGTGSGFGVLARSSLTTERPDWTPANVEKAQIARRRGSDRTEADEVRLRELECYTSLYLDEGGAPTLPAAAFRANIEAAARKLRQGPQVREGLIVEQVECFDYDRSLGTSPEVLVHNVQFTVGVRVRQARLLRTRARFDEWAATFRVDVDPELVDREQLLVWLDIGGRRLGLGDWRPEKSGSFGRFEVESIETLS